MISRIAAFLIVTVLLLYVWRIVVQLHREQGKYFEVLSSTAVPFKWIRGLAYAAFVNVALIFLFSSLGIAALFFSHTQ